MSLLLFDELNNFETQITELLKEAFAEEGKGSEALIKYCEDSIFDMLLYAWSVGRYDTIGELGNILGFEVTTDVNTEEMLKSINKEIEGETYKERLAKQIADKSIDGIKKIIETETMRNYNTAKDHIAQNTDTKGVTIRKRWVTAGDDRVRDTHDYLEGVVVGMNDRFYTYDGDSARFPNDFALPQNNINCRCEIVYIQ